MLLIAKFFYIFIFIFKSYLFFLYLFKLSEFFNNSAFVFGQFCCLSGSDCYFYIIELADSMNSFSVLQFVHLLCFCKVKIMHALTKQIM